MAPSSSSSSDTYTIVVLPVVDDCKHTQNAFCDPENDPKRFLKDASDWFEKISSNRCRLDFILLSALTVPQNLNAFSIGGGMGPPPHNSQSLAECVLLLADDLLLKSLIQASGNLVIVSPGRFKPHTWHIPNGGKPIRPEEERRIECKAMCRRYTLVPEKTNLGMLAHELGHLLFSWPDLKWPRAYAKECLMAEGASNDSGDNPAEPCAPLLHRQGWRDELAIERNTPVHALNRNNIGVLDRDGKKYIVEYRDESGIDAKIRQEKPRLLVYKLEAGGYPKIIAIKHIERHTAERKLLGVVAPFLRRF